MRSKFGLTDAQIGSKVAKTRDHVAQRRRLLTFSQELQELVSRDTISTSVAEAIAFACKLQALLNDRWAEYACDACGMRFTARDITEEKPLINQIDKIVEKWEETKNESE